MLFWSMVALSLAAPCAGTPREEAARIVAGDPAAADRWYALAPCLDGLGFPHAAEQAWLRGIAADEDRSREPEALDALRRLADASGDDGRFAAAVQAAKQPRHAWFPGTASRWALVEGIQLWRSGDAAAAADRLAQVDRAFLHRFDAAYLTGTIRSSQDRLKSAVLAWKEVYEGEWIDPLEDRAADRLEHLKDLALLGIAGVYLEMDRTEADGFLSQRRKGSPFEAQALVQLGWDSPKKTKQALKAAPTWSPDAALLAVARAEDVPAAAREARPVWEAHRDALGAWITTWEARPGEAVEAWKKAPYAPVQPDLALDLAWTSAVASYDGLASERARIDPSWGPLAEAVRAELDAVAPTVAENAGKELLRALKVRRAEAEEVLRRLDAAEKGEPVKELPWAMHGWGP
jgi:hypothetical protein